jgi:hypothetical protein
MERNPLGKKDNIDKVSVVLLNEEYSSFDANDDKKFGTHISK